MSRLRKMIPTEQNQNRDGRPILIVLHQERSSPGRVGQLLVEKGYRLDIRRPVLGQPLPTTLKDHGEWDLPEAAFGPRRTSVRWMPLLCVPKSVVYGARPIPQADIVGVLPTATGQLKCKRSNRTGGRGGTVVLLGTIRPLPPPAPRPFSLPVRESWPDRLDNGVSCRMPSIPHIPGIEERHLKCPADDCRTVTSFLLTTSGDLLSVIAESSNGECSTKAYLRPPAAAR